MEMRENFFREQVMAQAFVLLEKKPKDGAISGRVFRVQIGRFGYASIEEVVQKSTVARSNFPEREQLYPGIHLFEKPKSSRKNESNAS